MTPCTPLAGCVADDWHGFWQSDTCVFALNRWRSGAFYAELERPGSTWRDLYDPPGLPRWRVCTPST